MYYTNGSTVTKTFHGVTFHPGETKEVSGIINDPKFVLSYPRQEPPTRSEKDSYTIEESEEIPKRRRGKKSSTESSHNEASDEGTSSDESNTIIDEVDKSKEV